MRTWTKCFLASYTVGSRSTHFPSTVTKITFLEGDIKFHFLAAAKNIPFSLSIHLITSRLVPCLGYCKVSQQTWICKHVYTRLTRISQISSLLRVILLIFIILISILWNHIMNNLFEYWYIYITTSASLIHEKNLALVLRSKL